VILSQKFCCETGPEDTANTDTMDSDDSLELDSDDSWESDVDMEGEEESEEEKMFLEPQEIIALATNDTRVLIIDGRRDDDTLCNFRKHYEDYEDNVIWECWKSYREEDLPPDYDEPKTGPDCHLCGEEIVPDDERITINGDYFTLIWREDVKREEDIKEVGILQCVYCFNFYHRHKCSLLLSHASYLSKKLSKTWSCANCVPVFKPKSKMILQKSYDKSLIKIFKFTCKYFDKNVCNIVVDFNLKVDVLNQFIHRISEFGVFDNG